MSTWFATKRLGFTIVELLIVLLIIGLLLSLSGLQISNSRRRARDAARMANLSEYAQAAEQSAQLTGGRYPLPGSSSTGVSCADEMVLASGLDKRLFNNSILPKDPRTLQPAQAGCPSAEYGYRYHTLYGLNPASEATNANRAFVLEALFEEERSADDITLQSPSELNSSAQAQTTGRWRYFLAGRWCGQTEPCYK